MNRIKLSEKSFKELNELRLSIENKPTNRMPKGSFYTSTLKARKQLSDIAWAITNKLGRKEKENANSRCTRRKSS